MRIHLITVVGAHVEVFAVHARSLPRARHRVLCHQCGTYNARTIPYVTWFAIVVKRFGCQSRPVTVGDWQTVMHGMWQQSTRMRPDDWCVLADQDELHRYPDRLSSLLAYLRSACPTIHLRRLCRSPEREWRIAGDRSRSAALVSVSAGRVYLISDAGRGPEKGRRRQRSCARESWTTPGARRHAVSD